jgi:hypothetical protein
MVHFPGKIDRDRHCAAAPSLRGRAPLAISDICGELDEAFPVITDLKKIHVVTHTTFCSCRRCDMRVAGAM